MTTLQEASTKALDALRKAMQGNLDFDVALEAFEALRTALAQQGEQQPVCHGCGIPAGDVHMSTCQSGKWPSRVSNGDTAAPAPQAQECKPLCELCVKRGYAFCANVAQTTPITVQSAHGIREVK